MVQKQQYYYINWKPIDTLDGIQPYSLCWICRNASRIEIVEHSESERLRTAYLVTKSGTPAEVLAREMVYRERRSRHRNPVAESRRTTRLRKADA